MRVTICGARGSTPAPGPDHVRYGGHTSCVALAHDGESPSLVLDAGTGIRRRSPAARRPSLRRGRSSSGTCTGTTPRACRSSPAPTVPDARTDVYMPAQGDAEEVLRRVMSPPHFPITPAQLRGTWRFHGPRARHGARHRGLHRPRPRDPAQGGPDLRLPRLRRHGHDRLPVGPLSHRCSGPGPTGSGSTTTAALALARHCDVLLHDAQYLDDELPARASFGHASSGYAVRLAERRRGPARAAVPPRPAPHRRRDRRRGGLLRRAARCRWTGPPRAWSSTSPPPPHPDRGGVGSRAAWPTVPGHGGAGRAGGGQLPRA